MRPFFICVSDCNNKNFVSQNEMFANLVRYCLFTIAAKSRAQKVIKEERDKVNCCLIAYVSVQLRKPIKKGFNFQTYFDNPSEIQAIRAMNKGTVPGVY